MTDNPAPETKNCRATFQGGEPIGVTVTTFQFTDDYVETTFTFKMEGTTAVLHSITPSGEKYYVQQDKMDYVQQSEMARRQARETVQNLPFVQAVEML